MEDDLDNIALVRLVNRIMQNDGSEEEITTWLAAIERRLLVPDGYVSDLIVWSQDHGWGAAPSAEAAVEQALAYRPIQLSHGVRSSRSSQYVAM